MRLAQQLWGVWDRLRDAWWPFLSAAGLHLESAKEADLLDRLLQPINIRRDLPGLEELALHCKRGIHPCDPARSLFYHALASPHCVPDNIPDSLYPTMAELSIVENCIYAAGNITWSDLLQHAQGSPLAIGVFAYEYAPAIDTIHRRHADLCFSRTGIARVGNANYNYISRARGFFPSSGQPATVHVVPARYGAFLAVQRQGSAATFGPLRASPRDHHRQFWVPLHKLFSGEECIQGIPLKIEFEMSHLNEKVRKVHQALQLEGYDTGWNAAQMTKFPFLIEDGLATFCDDSGLVIPIPHSPMIEPARTAEGELVGFCVPPRHNTFASSLWFSSTADARSSPEFVHAKHAIITDELGHEDVVFLPDIRSDDIRDVVKNGKYTAANFIDWTADGWIKAHCHGLPHIHRKLPAYSVLAQPDFFPLVKQQDIAQWWKHIVPKDLQHYIWPDRGIVPTSLAGARIPANIAQSKAKFDSADHTMTAIVGLARKPGPRGKIIATSPHRESTLSYRATNLFEPGWDASKDFGHDTRSKNGTFFLSNYGLSSPFAEDTLICAASGGYWPGAVPDTTRFFAPHAYPSSTPIPDSEVGWDGIPLPITDNNIVTYQNFAYADYVRAIWKRSLLYEAFAHVDLDEYTARTQAMARVFQFLKIQIPKQRAKIAVLSFRPPDAREFYALLEGSDWNSALSETYRFEVAQLSGHAQPSRGDPRILQEEIQTLTVLFASRSAVAKIDPQNAGAFLVQSF
jgi:hypothetical protein